MSRSKPVKTPFLKAVSKLINHQATHIPETMVIDMYIVGGAAVHYWLRYRPTDDVDAIYGRRMGIPSHFENYKDEAGNPKDCFLDYSFNPDWTLFQNYHKEGAVNINKELCLDKRLNVFVCSPINLAVNMIHRFSLTDKENLKALTRAGFVDLEKFKTLSSKTIEDALIESTELLQHQAEAISIIEKALLNPEQSKLFLDGIKMTDYLDSEESFARWILDEDVSGAFAVIQQVPLTKEEAEKGRRAVKAIILSNVKPFLKEELSVLEARLAKKAKGHNLDRGTEFHFERMRQRYEECQWEMEHNPDKVVQKPVPSVYDLEDRRYFDYKGFKIVTGQNLGKQAIIFDQNWNQALNGIYPSVEEAIKAIENSVKS